MNKKLLSLLLALVMVFSFIPAFAAEEAPAETDKKVEETEKAVEEAEEVAAPEEAETTPEFVKFLTDNGYVQGDKKGDLMLDKNLTRAQFTALLARLDGKDDVAKAMKTLGTKFTDVTEAHWAIGYINFAAGKAWVNGYPDGTFGPEREVTYAEIATVLVRYLGVDTMGFSYPVDYVAKAYELGLMKGLPAIENHKQAATRQDMFQMLYNTISQKDFGRFNVYKMIVLENNRTTNLRPNEVKAEVLSIVQQANNVDERGIAKVGEQKKFSLVRKNAKDEDQVIADSENLLGKVINATVNENNELVKVEIDNSYDYLFGGISAASAKVFGVGGDNYDVRVDERYYNRDNRRYDNDDRMYRTYLTTSDGVANFSYKRFADEIDAEKINPNFARITVKDGMVMFIDAFQWKDVAPVQEVKRDGKDVYYYDDASDATIRRVSPTGRVIGYTEKDGFYNLDIKDIKKDDVIHWTENLFFVRQDAPVSGKLVKHFVNKWGEHVTVDEDDYYLNSGADVKSPYRSVYGYKDHYRTTMSRFNLNEMLNDDVTILRDIAGDVQLIRSGRTFNDRLALVKNFAYGELAFFGPNKTDDFKTNWDTNTIVTYKSVGDKYINHTESTNARTADHFGRLDLTYTLAGSEKAAEVIALYETRQQMAKTMTKVTAEDDLSKWNAFIRIGGKQMRYNAETEVYAVEDLNKANSRVYKITMGEAIAHIRNIGALDAYAVSQADYARFLNERRYAGIYRYNEFAEDLAKTIVFSGWQGLGYDPEYRTYARVDVNQSLNNYSVRLELGNGEVKDFDINKEFNEVRAMDLRHGQELFVAVLKDEKSTTDGVSVVIEKVLKTPEDFQAYGVYSEATNTVQNAFSVDGKLFYRDGGTKTFGSYSRWTPYAKVVGLNGSKYNPGYAKAIYFTNKAPKSQETVELTALQKNLLKQYENAVNEAVKAAADGKTEAEVAELIIKANKLYDEKIKGDKALEDAAKAKKEESNNLEKAFKKAVDEEALLKEVPAFAAAHKDVEDGDGNTIGEITYDPATATATLNFDDTFASTKKISELENVKGTNLIKDAFGFAKKYNVKKLAFGKDAYLAVTNMDVVKQAILDQLPSLTTNLDDKVETLDGKTITARLIVEGVTEPIVINFVAAK